MSEKQLFGDDMDPDAVFTDEPDAAAPAASSEGGNAELLKFLASQAVTNERVASALEALSKANEAGPTPQIPLSKYKAKTPWNPSGERYKTKMTRTFWQNGSLLRPILMAESTIQRLNQLKPGTYRNGKWSVVQGAAGTGEGTLPPLHIIVPNKTQEQRMENAMLFRTLDELLDLILEEQNALAS